MLGGRWFESIFKKSGHVEIHHKAIKIGAYVDFNFFFLGGGYFLFVCLFCFVFVTLDDFHQSRSSEGVTSTSRPQLQRDGWIRTLQRFCTEGLQKTYGHYSATLIAARFKIA